MNESIFRRSWACCPSPLPPRPPRLPRPPPPPIIPHPAAASPSAPPSSRPASFLRNNSACRIRRPRLARPSPSGPWHAMAACRPRRLACSPSPASLASGSSADFQLQRLQPLDLVAQAGGASRSRGRRRRLACPFRGPSRWARKLLPTRAPGSAFPSFDA